MRAATAHISPMNQPCVAMSSYRPAYSAAQTSHTLSAAVGKLNVLSKHANGCQLWLSVQGPRREGGPRTGRGAPTKAHSEPRKGLSGHV